MGAPAFMATEDLYRSDLLLARHCQPDHPSDWMGGGETIFVTFGSYSDQHTLERAGFGEEFFHRHGLHAIHVLSRDNSWYQHEEMDALLEAVRQRTRGFRNVFTYGSSMGAYAALRHARFLQATAIAMGPQYSVDPRVMRRENRWQESFHLPFVTERRQPIAQPRRAYVFYDSRSRLELLHMRRICRDITVTPVGLPYAGHIVANHLASTGQLSRAVRQIVEGRFDPARCIHAVWSARARSSCFFETRTELLSRRHPHRALSCARQAFSLHPRSGAVLHTLARCLLRVGDTQNAVRMAQRAVEREPAALPYRRFLAMAYLSAGDFEACRAELETLLEEGTNLAATYHSLAKYHARQHQYDAAVDYEKRALALNPARALYARTLLLHRLARKLHALGLGALLPK
ncbi:tetratricopeptide repeat protein [Oecophyllibacter saccharovorans]|uniref:tetratricopeptide repeat protein n=1 Tax=Oecophyllibacter saccharovorans TaxID=2558360 RepID=UPI0011703E65|nr:tetratricopeptide repeat protein [Oecophyllibacter saccharovorans]TPW36650.1 tetratricopeptide repeat protein [Oecophyllibacter saccharovorans]